MEASNIRTKAGTFTILEKGIVQITWDAKRLDLEDCTITISNIHLYTRQRPLYYISDIKDVKGMSKGARDYFKSVEFQCRTGGIALIVGNGISKITANFFISSLKDGRPIKAFNKKEAALSWLISLKTKNQ